MTEEEQYVCEGQWNKPGNDQIKVKLKRRPRTDKYCIRVEAVKMELAFFDNYEAANKYYEQKIAELSK